MSGTFKQVIRFVLWGVAALIVIGCAALGVLIYPGTPGAAKSLDFKGYVLLPKGQTLTVLDYLTVYENSLFITDESAGNVYKMPLQTAALPTEADISVFALEPSTHGVVVDPTSRLAYVTRSEANTVDVFDPTNMKLAKRIPVADDPDGIFYDPVHKLIYAASGDANVGTVFDPATQSSVGTIPLGGKPEFAVFDSQTNLLYQNLRDTNSVVALALEKRAVTERWTLDHCQGPSGMAIDEPNRRLFVVCATNSMLVVFDLAKKTVMRSVPIGGAPDSVVFDAGLRRIYTTGKSGVMVVVQQDSADAYHVIDSVSLHYGAHTLAVDPATHKVYVGYAGLLARARVAIFEPRT